MKKSLSLLFFFVSSIVFAQTEKYSRIKIYADEIGIIELAKAGLSFDHGEMKQGLWFSSDFSESEISIVKSKGYKYDVLIDDVKQYYKEQNNPESRNYKSAGSRSAGCTSTPNYATPSNFTLGTMGGYFTYSEIMWHLDNLATLYPNLVKAKLAIGANTVDGHPIYWMKISDNPTVDEPEPEILYTAVHHAREPASISQLIMYMYYLCENYATNPEVKYLVDNEEMYFIPLVNPDGYVYNETTDPTGGGLWRKNRIDNGDGTFGVDINRNYGYNWGIDDLGSSPVTNSGTYRGTSAFSEIETQNVRDFCNAHQFQLTFNYHTYGNLLIYPWESSSNVNDSTQYLTYLNYLTTYNKFAVGTDMHTVLYTTNGSSDEWMYGEQNTKPKIMAMTPEAGRHDEGFWPPQNRIIDICKENIWPNITFAHLALKYAVAKDEQPNYIASKNGYLHYSIKRLGLENTGSYTVSIVPVGNAIASVGTSKTYSSLTPLEEISDSIPYTLNTITSGSAIKYAINVSNGLYTSSDTITKRFGATVIEFSSNGNSMSGWKSSSSGWGVTSSNFHSSTSSITDSPFGDYDNDRTNRISTTNSLDLTDALSAQLIFWARWELETNFDYVETIVSTDNGSSWTPLCGRYTKAGNDNEDFENPLYDGYKQGWVKEEVSLDDYIGQNIKIGFQLVADQGKSADGFYFDDLKVEKMVSASGINESNKNKIFVSQNMPNPASDYTYINYSFPTNVENATIVVFNTFGQMVMEEEISSSEGSIMLNTSKLAQGVYYYVLKSDKFSSTALKLSVVK
jgi:carboxypeptidase T